MSATAQYYKSHKRIIASMHASARYCTTDTDTHMHAIASVSRRPCRPAPPRSRMSWLWIDSRERNAAAIHRNGGPKPGDKDRVPVIGVLVCECVCSCVSACAHPALCLFSAKRRHGRIDAERFGNDGCQRFLMPRKFFVFFKGLAIKVISMVARYVP